MTHELGAAGVGLPAGDNEELFSHSELTQVRRREATLTARVTALIEKLIVDNRLQPGDRLPSVRDLAERFGVSRTVVREAVGALVAKSMLEARHGSGTRVRAPTPQSVAQSMSLMLRAGQTELDYSKVHELRRVLEVEIAGLAAERRSEDDLRKLELNLQEMAAIVSNAPNMHGQREAYVANDLAFHAALAHATHNELFVMVLDSVADVMRKIREMSFDVPGSHQHALQYHRKIFEQITTGAPVEARQAMYEHLADSEALQQQALRFHAAPTKVV